MSIGSHFIHECSCFIEFIKRVEEKIKCGACRAFYLFFCNEFNIFNKTGERLLDSFYHIALKLF